MPSDTNDWALPWLGHCRCGQVEMRISAPPMLSMVCHCRGCQRMTGSAFSTSLAIPVNGFSCSGLDPVIGGMHAPDQRHHFCPHCMSWIFTRFPPEMPFVNVRATMLDDCRWYAPFVETMTAERLDFVHLDVAESFEGMPPMEVFPGFVERYAKEARRPTPAGRA